MDLLHGKPTEYRWQIVAHYHRPRGNCETYDFRSARAARGTFTALKKSANIVRAELWADGQEVDQFTKEEE